MLEVDVLPAPVVAHAREVSEVLTRNAEQRLDEERALSEAVEEEENIAAEF